MFGQKLVAAKPKPSARPKQQLTKVRMSPQQPLSGTALWTARFACTPFNMHRHIQLLVVRGPCWADGRGKVRSPCAVEYQPRWSFRGLRAFVLCRRACFLCCTLRAGRCDEACLLRQLEGFSVGEEDCGMMGGNCGQRLFSTRPNRVRLASFPPIVYARSVAACLMRVLVNSSADTAFINKSFFLCTQGVCTCASPTPAST